mmetsp:Transcript_8334/g.24672  ORF Transcript_8334/g.24672 Transcript_8334/m.24672 type:complete len:238 (+) Transcript_8334:423-1136(+)
MRPSSPASDFAPAMRAAVEVAPYTCAAERANSWVECSTCARDTADISRDLPEMWLARGWMQHHGGQALADALDDDAREDGVRLHLRLEEGERRPRGRRVGAVCKHRSRDGLGLQRGEGGEGCVERSVAESRGSLDEGRLSAKGGAPARVREARRGDDEPVESTQVDAALRGQPPLCCDRLDLRHHRAGRKVGERGLATEQAVAESVHALAERWPIPRRGTGRVLRLKSAGAPQHAEG